MLFIKIIVIEVAILITLFFKDFFHSSFCFISFTGSFYNLIIHQDLKFNGLLIWV